MHATCPDCGCRAPLASFFIEDDGKRLALLVADMQPPLGRRRFLIYRYLNRLNRD